MKTLAIFALLFAIGIAYIFSAPSSLFTDNPHIFPRVATVVVSQQVATKTASQANRHK
jgi:hypothetical protein